MSNDSKDDELRDRLEMLYRPAPTEQEETIYVLKDDLVEFIEQYGIRERIDEASKCYKLANEYRKEAPIAISNMRLEPLRHELNALKDKEVM